MRINIEKIWRIRQRMFYIRNLVFLRRKKSDLYTRFYPSLTSSLLFIYSIRYALNFSENYFETDLNILISKISFIVSFYSIKQANSLRENATSLSYHILVITPCDLTPIKNLVRKITVYIFQYQSICDTFATFVSRNILRRTFISILGRNYFALRIALRLFGEFLHNIIYINGLQHVKKDIRLVSACASL